MSEWICRDFYSKIMICCKQKISSIKSKGKSTLIIFYDSIPQLLKIDNLPIMIQMTNQRKFVFITQKKNLRKFNQNNLPLYKCLFIGFCFVIAKI